MARTVKPMTVDTRQFVKSIEALKDRVSGKDTRRVLMRAAIVMRDEARNRAPVDTGLLRESIIASYGNPNRSDEVSVFFGPDYRRGGSGAHFSEIGTSKEPARPWLRPAIAAKKKEAAQIIEEGLKDIIEDTE